MNKGLSEKEKWEIPEPYESKGLLLKEDIIDLIPNWDVWLKKGEEKK